MISFNDVCFDVFLYAMMNHDVFWYVGRHVVSCFFGVQCSLASFDALLHYALQCDAPRDFNALMNE